MTPLLAIENLRVLFKTERGPAIAVDGVSFDANAGETVCLVGESGCGKSVTALSIMGLVPRASATTTGRVVFDGHEVLTAASRLDDATGNR